MHVDISEIRVNLLSRTDTRVLLTFNKTTTYAVLYDTAKRICFSSYALLHHTFVAIFAVTARTFLASVKVHVGSCSGHFCSGRIYCASNHVSVPKVFVISI